MAARAASAPTASAASYRTATAEKRAVEQRLVLTGTVARVAQKTAAFPMSATVTNVAVGVGDTVTAGQPLASVDRAPLTSELLDAEAQVAQAKATLESDQSSSASSTSTPAARSSGSSGSGGGTAALLRPVTLAMQAQERSCARVFGSTGGGPTSSSTSPTSSSTSPTSASTSPTSSSTSPTSSSRSPTSSPTSPTSSSTSPTSAPTTPPSTAPPGPTTSDLVACAKALRALSAAEAKASTALGAYARDLSATAGGQPRSTPASGTEVTSAVSAARIVLDQLAVTTAQQRVTQAKANLAASTLLAPISGIVGSVGLTTRLTASTSSGVVIVGSGAVEVTVSVPLAQRPSMSVGQQAFVTPAGSSDEIEATVTSIGILPSSDSTSSGATPSYPAVVLVAAAPKALTTGARAQVSFVISSVGQALTVPVSAVTSLTTGSAFVQVVENGTATRTAVVTGAVGQGYVELTSGLSEGAVVVLADRTAELPTNSTQNLRRITGGGAGGPPAGGGASTGGRGGPPAGAPAAG